MCFTYQDRPFVEARRTLRHLVRVNRALLADEHEFMAADRSIAPDVYDEFHEDDDYACTDGTSTMTRLLEAVAVAYGYPTERLDDCIWHLDEREQELSSPCCPFHDRGLECRNSAPRGIDADGEPYGDCGCGCDTNALRSAALRRLRTVQPC